ncbi:MAG: OsmC family protein [Bdellovibrionales bacterium]
MIVTAKMKNDLVCAIRAENGTEILTSSPRDLGPGGEMTPTELLGAALAGCVLISLVAGASKRDLFLGDLKVEAALSMADSPRRLGAVRLEIYVPEQLATEVRPELEMLAHNCPVSRSMNTSIEIKISFHWGKC